MENYDPDVSQWWETSIIDMAPGKIAFRGEPVQALMGNISFVDMIWWMIFGKKLTPAQKNLFEAALVMSVDHGPQAPAIAISRMAATCGIGINNVLASAINVLGDNHGGAGEQCAGLFYATKTLLDQGKDLATAVTHVLEKHRTEHGKTIPGYGHRFHKTVDPRAPRVLEIVRQHVKEGQVEGAFVDIAEEFERQINIGRKNHITMNVDGGSSVIFCTLGVPAVLSRGLFCLARSVGILAHAWEQTRKGEKNKGPVPKKYLPHYSGLKS